MLPKSISKYLKADTYVNLVDTYIGTTTEKIIFFIVLLSLDADFPTMNTAYTNDAVYNFIASVIVIVFFALILAVLYLYHYVRLLLKHKAIYKEVRNSLFKLNAIYSDIDINILARDDVRDVLYISNDNVDTVQISTKNK